MFDPIEEVIAAVGRGEMVVLVDDENRENEGDLICAGSLVDAKMINFMVTWGRGVLCAPMSLAFAARLGLKEQEGRHDPRHTAFTQSVDVIEGTTTGVSAFDRALTIQALADESSILDDFYSPGHVFPLIPRPGGVLERPGHTEATVDIAHLAGLPAVGVLCEILNQDGTMARVPQLEGFAWRFNLKIGSVMDLIEYRKCRKC